MFGFKVVDGRFRESGAFMHKPRLLLEADRERLYKRMPVPDGWHEDYAMGKVTTDAFLKVIG